MPAAKWEVDEKAVDAMLAEPGVAAHLSTIAQAGVEKARASAPVATGAYRDSLAVTAPRNEGGKLIVGFGSDSWHWHFVEYGTATNPAHRVLSGAAQAVADRTELL